LRQELQVGQLRAYLLVRPRVVPPSRRSNAPGYDDGKRFEIAAHYWATENASDAIHDRWVEAPVLEPLPPSAYRQVNKGGYVLLEEKAIGALIAGEDSADECASTADLFEETYWSIPQALCWAATRSAKAMARYFTPAPGHTFSDVFYRDEIHALLMSMKRDYSPLRANVEDIETAARLDRIQIEGREDGRSPWGTIPLGNWGGGQYSGGLKLRQRDHNGGIEAADPVDPSSNRKLWTHLRVKREDMLRAFEPNKGQDRPGQPEAEFAATAAPERMEADKYDSAAEFFRQNEQSILRDLKDAKQPHGIGVIRREAARRWNQMDGNKNRQVKDDGSAFTKVKQRTKRSGA
jgi:hypothetical protein